MSRANLFVEPSVLRFQWIEVEGPQSQYLTLDEKDVYRLIRKLFTSRPTMAPWVGESRHAFLAIP
jgi:hypothetical protein